MELTQERSTIRRTTMRATEVGGALEVGSGRHMQRRPLEPTACRPPGSQAGLGQGGLADRAGSWQLAVGPRRSCAAHEAQCTAVTAAVTAAATAAGGRAESARAVSGPLSTAGWTAQRISRCPVVAGSEPDQAATAADAAKSVYRGAAGEASRSPPVRSNRLGSPLHLTVRAVDCLPVCRIRYRGLRAGLVRQGYGRYGCCRGLWRFGCPVSQLCRGALTQRRSNGGRKSSRGARRAGR